MELLQELVRRLRRAGAKIAAEFFGTDRSNDTHCRHGYGAWNARW